MNNNGNQNIVPFGKYKGQPLEILANDPNYVEWLNGQGWVKDKYPQFYTVIINNFQEPSDTPEHNALQALFLDDEFCIRFLNILGNSNRVRNILRNWQHMVLDNSHPFFLNRINFKNFETAGVDVYIRFTPWILGDGNKWSNHKYFEGDCAIEIKPSIGDDFPSVLRQAQRMDVSGARCVVYRDFVATSVTIDQVKSMFKHSVVSLFSLDEIWQSPATVYPDEPELPN